LRRLDDALGSSIIPILGIVLVLVVTTMLSITGILVVQHQNNAGQVVLTRIQRTGDENTATLRRLVDDVEKVLVRNRLSASRAHCALATILIAGNDSRAAKALLKAACP
jgi:hypothetical protein